MNEIDGSIQIYQTLFLLCMSLAVVFLIITLVLFMKLKIFLTVSYLTGRSKKREIEQLEQSIKKKEENFQGEFVLIQEIILLHTEEVIREGG